MKTVTSLRWLLLLCLLTVCECNVQEVTELEGQNVTLPCKYNIKEHGQLPVCWGKGHLPNSGCSDLLIATDGTKVIKGSRKSDRFQLLGDVRSGDVSLTIKNVTNTDSGPYGCRVEIPGWFNDKKHHIKLTVEKAPEPITSTASDHVTFTEHTPSNQTQGHMNSTESADILISHPSQTEEIKTSSFGPGVLAFIVLSLVLVSAAGVIFIGRRVKRHNKTLHTIPLSAGSEQFTSSGSSMGLHNRQPALENIYQIDENNDYEFCL
ncbi:hepatitis A virus cellular receptor 1 [Lampris incognitus]|uniref:hepatitis A virus cellular receptor 1 n=1 Tax=Lampris incognitus TaxID=2546036 RepID=UPI0024B4935A|nr:hepatitis A virus cellular receptor 1 [Lampris incognitus]